MDSGGSWAPFGRGLGRSGPPLGHFWALFGRYLGVLNQPFFKHRSKMESKRPFGSILEGFWEDSGRLWGGFGEGLGRIWEDFFSFSANLGQGNSDKFCRFLRPPRCSANSLGVTIFRRAAGTKIVCFSMAEQEHLHQYY